MLGDEDAPVRRDAGPPAFASDRSIIICRFLSIISPDVSQPPATAVTPYDTVAIFTGSALVLPGAAPDKTSPGVVQIYPGLCTKALWPTCETGTLLAQAVPADYAGDELLTNWTKSAPGMSNPIVENTQRDPSTPWKTPSGEWRLRTYDSMVYAAKNDGDLLAGKWYTVGQNADFRTCECPSLYELPRATPGFESEYEALKGQGGRRRR